MCSLLAQHPSCVLCAFMALHIPSRIPPLQTPFIADLKPSGRYVMEDLHKVGGTPGVLKYLLQRNMINGNCMTVTGASRLL